MTIHEKLNLQLLGIARGMDAVREKKQPSPDCPVCGEPGLRLRRDLIECSLNGCIRFKMGVRNRILGNES